MFIAILGCGPAGLLARHAVAMAGYPQADIYSRMVKSEMPGAQYVHEHIPGTPGQRADGLIRFEKWGVKKLYAERVYGSPDAECSWDKFEEGDVQAWSMGRVYDWLWDQYEKDITDTDVNSNVVDILRGDYDLVISSIPAPILCDIREHRFESVGVNIAPVFALPEDPRDNTIIYNGGLKGDWYRTSRIFGNASTESRYDMLGAVRGVKPLRHSCDCRPHVMRVGRFGRWERGVLVNHAFHAVANRMEEL